MENAAEASMTTEGLAPTEAGELLDWIISHIPEDLRDTTRAILEQAVEMSLDQETRRAQAERWLSWARHREHVGVVSADVPINVLPGGHRGQLHDVRVTCRRGPDDAIYDKHKDIRDKVARGNCFLEVNSGPQAGISCVVYALKKFTGGLGDDDDKDRGDDSTWKRYFTKPLEAAVSVVSTRKANGEAAHLAARCIDGRVLICAGSKNVHMLFRNRGDLERYVGPRYAVAQEVCTTVLECLEEMPPEQRNRLLSFLCLTEYTAILEILNPGHQHVEDLSHLNRPLLQFICWTTSDLEASSKDTLCTMPPSHAIEVARCLGVPTVIYEVLPVAKVDDQMKQIRQAYGYEGEVLYFLDETQSVIGLLKKKTIWYILCRAIREKARHACRNAEKPGHFSKERSLSQVTGRVGEIQSWLGLDDNTTAAWKELGVGFLNWAIHKVQSGQESSTTVIDLFPVTWKKYLAEENRTDKIQAHWTEPSGSDE